MFVSCETAWILCYIDIWTHKRVACLVEMRNAYKVLVGILEGNDCLGNIAMYVRVILGWI